MRAHDRTSSRVARGAWYWLILAAAVARGPVPARAQDSPLPQAAGLSTDPVELAAHLVQVWDAGGARWIALRDEVAIFQGVEGFRASQAVVKLVPIVKDATPGYQIDVYAEGLMRPGGQPDASRRSYRTTLLTEKEVRLNPYREQGLRQLSGPPEGLPILDRAFPGAAKAPVVADARPAPAPAAPASAPSPRRSPIVAARAAETGQAARPGPGLSSNVARPADRAAVQVVAPPSMPGPSPRPGPSPAAAMASSETAPARPPKVELLPELTTIPDDLPALPPKIAGEDRPAPVDRAVMPAQFEPDGFPSDPAGAPQVNMPPIVPPGEAAPYQAPAGDVPEEDVEAPPDDKASIVPNLTPAPGGRATDLDPIPGPGPNAGNRPGPPGANAPSGNPPPGPEIPIMPGTQRIIRIYPRTGGSDFTFQQLPDADGYSTVVIRGGVTIVADQPPPMGTVDVSADNVVIWRRLGPRKGPGLNPNGETVEDVGQPMEVYLEGDVVLRQDTRQVAGNGDQKTYRAKQGYYDFRTGRFIGLEAELDMFAPGLISPTKTTAPRIEQYRPVVRGADGRLRYGLEEIRADGSVTTGSRFPIPGYRFTSRFTDITHVVSTKVDPITGKSPVNPRNPNAPQDLTWRIDARGNTFFFGPAPVFYYPRIIADADDIEPPLRQIRYGFNNYLGQEILSDFNAFRLFSIRKPQWIDAWTVDIDYMSMRTKDFPALGSEIGWFGNDFFGDLTDPYRKKKRPADQNVSPDGYFGYLDLWALRDSGVDVLGAGPAINTQDIILPDGINVGKRGFQRGPSGIPGLPNGNPPFQKFRGRVNFRHMQSLVDSDADPYEEFRVQVEAGYYSDRYFLEEYYKRLYETGLDQELLAYVIRQKDNWAWSAWAEGNPMSWNTETQWLPRLDYYRIGDNFLANRVSYFQHSGVDYGVTTTATEVNNPNIFAFMPYDPISNTSGVFRSGRIYTNHEVDLPLNFNNMVRFIPYVQGQAVGWSNQLDGQGLGRVWGAAGARADVMFWKRYPDVESDLFNVHGLNHKVTLAADYRNAVSNVKLNQIGIQDDLDDNTYEQVRRYFALTQYAGGVLPPQYDPRHLILRRALSPITGPTDVQASIETLQFNMHSRLQTKRGPIGRRRVIDYMTLDLSTTYFPYAERDNFGKAFGQNMYNFQWFIGDRTSILSYGWFEFFDIGGQQLNKTIQPRLGQYPFGINVITSGVSISRPPRGNIFLGYSVIDTGPITTSALSASASYWLSPKWYGTVSTMYDFGNAILLNSFFSFTRIGADYLTTVGMLVDPQRHNFNQISIAISPRISPGLRFGSGSGLTQFDSRLAPSQ